MQFWPHDDEHMCSKHVEAWNKIIVKQKFFCIKLAKYCDKKIRGQSLKRTETFENKEIGTSMWQTLDYNKEWLRSVERKETGFRNNNTRGSS